MEYRRSTYMGDYSIDEVFEGTPEEILEILNGINEEGNGLIYDQEDAMDFIRLRLKKDHEAEITEGLLRAILELEEDYMRSVGIAAPSNKTSVYVDEFNVYKTHKLNEEETLKFLEKEMNKIRQL